MNTKFTVDPTGISKAQFDLKGQQSHLSEVQITLSILSLVHGSFVTIRDIASTHFSFIEISQFLEANEKNFDYFIFKFLYIYPK